MATILFIDEDASRSAGLIAALREQPLDCRSTRPGGRAVDAAQGLDPDVIVLGLSPEPHATRDLCAALRERPPLANTPVLVAGAEGLATRALECVEAGVSDWLALPLPEALIANRICTYVLLRRHQELIAEQGRALEAHVEDLDTTRTSLQKARAAERYLATHDYVTGLPNRELFDEFTQRSIEFARRHEQCLALLSIDLDRFARVNDALSHAGGDRLLKSVADRVTDCLRSSEMVARRAGDELTAVVLNLRTPHDASLAARKVLDRIAEPHMIGGRDVRVSASVGIALFPEQGESREELMRHAGVAMRSAKAEGGNSFAFYSPNLDQDSSAQATLEQDLLLALERDELDLHYQPQVDARTGQLVGVEALVRWEHPELGQIPPAHFIPLAETSGQINEMGEWVLRQACLQTRAWEQRGWPGFPVSVNVSLRQLRSKSFAEVVVQVLDDSKLDPAHLDLEVTENMIMDDVEIARETLTILSDIGVRVSIDDFGTGYSSLSVLGKFPAHTLKVDRVFVTDIASNPVQAAVTRTVLAVASELDLRVIAEGVETEDEMRYLADLGCHLMQGYLFGRPVAPAAFEDQWPPGAEAEVRLAKSGRS